MSNIPSKEDLKSLFPSHATFARSKELDPEYTMCQALAVLNQMYNKLMKTIQSLSGVAQRLSVQFPARAPARFLAESLVGGMQVAANQ